MAAPRRRRRAPEAPALPGRAGCLRQKLEWSALPVELGARCLALLADSEGLSSAMRCRLVCRAWAVWGETMVRGCPALSLHWRTPERFSYSWCVVVPGARRAVRGLRFRRRAAVPARPAGA
jgi:hypothetical protein